MLALSVQGLVTESSDPLAQLAQSVKAFAALKSASGAPTPIRQGRHVAPHAARHSLLRRGRALSRLRQWPQAHECLAAAVEHAQAIGDTQTLAQACLELAHIQAACSNPEAAVELVQRAQQAGGQMELVTDMLLAYARYRCAHIAARRCFDAALARLLWRVWIVNRRFECFLEHSLYGCRCEAGAGLRDSMQALRGGLGMFTQGAAATPASTGRALHCARKLTLKMAELLFANMHWEQARSQQPVELLLVLCCINITCLQKFACFH
jgi:hypothetical protein